MATISNLNVEVGDQDTVIIDSTETATNEDRIFGIGNGENEIIAKVWGSNDNQNWEEVDNKPIPPQGYENIIMGHNHFFYVKLTGKTSSVGKTSVVDGYFTYTQPPEGS
jgi:hypothetical protein